MRRGIVPVLARPNGGTVQYSLTMLEALRVLDTRSADDALVVFSPRRPELEALLRDMPRWTRASPEPSRLASSVRSGLRRLARDGVGRLVWQKLKPRVRRYPLDVETMPSRPELARWFARSNVELMLYPCHTSLAFEVGIPYVMAINDLAHRWSPEFPENAGGVRWEWAEHACRNGARHATLLLADSHVAREDILEAYGRYGVTEDRVKVLPFVPPPYLKSHVSPEERLRVRSKYRLPERFLFYPGEITPHKGHAQLLRALNLLNEQGHGPIPLVLCGFHRGVHREEYFAEVRGFAARQGLLPLLHYLEYVPDADMSALYAEATALVMLTFVPPTTLPICEAWTLDCPVVTSNIRGIREQVCDAAILVDPRSIESIADGICRLWTDDGLRQELARRGRQRLAAYTFDDFCARLDQILIEAKARVRASARAH